MEVVIWCWREAFWPRGGSIGRRGSAVAAVSANVRLLGAAAICAVWDQFAAKQQSAAQSRSALMLAPRNSVCTPVDAKL